MSSAGLAVTRLNADDFVLSPRFFHNALDLNANESIMIYLSVSGNMIPMRIFESDSIESVKLRIQTCKGFFVKNQRLVCRGRELARSNSLVRDYGVANGNVLHLVLRLSELQTISVRTVGGKELTFHVERYQDVGYVKRKISKRAKNLVDDEENQELIYDGEQLEDQRVIDDICKHNDAVIHLIVQKSAKVRPKPIEKNFELSIDASELRGRRKCEALSDELLVIPRKPLDRDFLLEPVIVNPKIEVPSAILDVIKMTFDGLDSGHDPIRSTEGSGGAYLMQDSAGLEYVSVFKPIDEEPKAVNNPQGLPLSPDGEGLKKGTRVGEGAFREVAAYLLDHPNKGPRALSGEAMGFSGVPPTGLVRCLHRGFNHPKDINVKTGSLQKFMKNNGSCEDIGPGAFPVEEVHKISVLDIRLANADRHAGNILFSKDETGRTTLIPIDHGYCLPESFEDCTFDWLYWPQARQPYSKDTIAYISSLDANKDIALLKSYGWDLPSECARTLHISTMLLQKGVKRGFTPYTIGSIMCRETLKKESMLEEIVQEALDSVLPGTSESTYLDTVSHIMDRHLDEVA